MRKSISFAILFISSVVYGQNTKEQFFKLTRDGFNEQNAYQTTAFVEQYFRLPGNSGFDKSIYYVKEILEKAGFQQQINDEFEAPMTYRVEKRPMKRNTWEPVAASITIVGQEKALQSFSTNRNMIPIYCSSTPLEGLKAEVVFVNKAKAEDLEGKDLSGKIIFGEIAAQRLIGLAEKTGAIGVLGYALPDYNQPTKHPTSIQFSAMNPNAKVWALFLSYQSKEQLKEACSKGKVELKVNIQTKSYPAEELTIIANIRGNKQPKERFVYSAHVQEPGANDNATGVGTLAEMARLSAELVRNGSLKPERSLTFLWGDEIVSTRRYIVEDTLRAKGIKWGMSLDMVGEDTEKTGGTFLLEKMPDPSAIWTRGTDKHSEWGAGHVSEKDLFPHYFNDFVFDICKEQGRYANWEVRFNPFEGGSDHTPFLQNKIPGLLMWHFTDVFYHTDNDRLDKVSPTTMKNVGISALTVAYTLITANRNTALQTVEQVKKDALLRLKTEFELSKKEIAGGADKDSEKHILQTWGNWYNGAVSSVQQMLINSRDEKIGLAIQKANTELNQQLTQYLKSL